MFLTVFPGMACVTTVHLADRLELDSLKITLLTCPCIGIGCQLEHLCCPLCGASSRLAWTYSHSSLNSKRGRAKALVFMLDCPQDHLPVG